MSAHINRIVMHHSAGALEPSAFDLQHYHRMVTGSGKVLDGKFPISANAIGRKLAPGTYAAHTRNLNGGAIGLALAAMADAQWGDPRACRAFPTRLQMDAFIVEAGRLCLEYGIEVTRQTVLSHAEVQITLGVTQAGKWDFDYDPYGILDSRDPVLIGDMLREKIRAAMGAAPVVATPGPAPTRPVLRRGSTGADVGDLQRLLGITQDRIFGPATQAAVIAHQKAHQLLADGIAGPATWASLERN
ncbi:peptidoglycan-binding protein [Paracoccus sp. MA]|uniref:peptidoglycan-binding domain-containing protein n=1 Tax=Paracoccus sp. MA TaxID=2895796 RepID=UPI001E55705F|nr:peptidoglycan-binding domain-containing protein [Paracoccus sp. MA]UFM64257.1 peptidoglycan-binding protein [Paracoccus sp. MA]